MIPIYLCTNVNEDWGNLALWYAWRWWCVWVTGKTFKHVLEEYPYKDDELICFYSAIYTRGFYYFIVVVLDYHILTCHMCIFMKH